MNELPAGLPAAGVVRVVGPEDAGTGFLVSENGLIVTCAHVLAGCAPGDTVRVEPHTDRRPLAATVDLLRDPPDMAVLRLADPVPPGATVLPLGRSPRIPQRGLRTFGYPQVRRVAGLPGELAVTGFTTDDAGYDQLVLRSEEATLGFSGAPVWDPDLGAVVGMVKSIVRADPGQRLGSTAFGVPADVIRDVCPELRLPGGCPYRGLEPFTDEHADYYYGREHATCQLLASLAARDFVPVVAVSGGGKSSLLQAGLAKGLRDGLATGLAQRIRCYLRVSGRPHAELLDSLAQCGMELRKELAEAPPRELAEAIRMAVPLACPAGLILIVDQYERLYTDCADVERKRFTELLLLLATGTVKVVIGLRADFYELALADLGERLADGQVALAPMGEQDLTRAITEPARKLLRSFQPGLAQQLVTDVRDRPGDLPLLQFALTQLWERDAEGGILTKETYQGLGALLQDGERLPGAQGALIGRAEQLWSDLSPDGQPRLQRILLGLIAVQPAGNGAASPAGSLRDLSRPALLAQWDDDDQRLIQRLIIARLLTADRAPAGGRATVEVSHEVLLRAWPRLRAWLEERAELVQWRARDLSPNLERWLDSGKSPEFLLPPSLLDPALRWLKDYSDELAGPPAGYIQASKWRRTRRNRLIGGTVAVLVTASLTVAGIFIYLQQAAVSAQQAAVRELTVADSSAMIIESQGQGDTDPVLSSLLSVAAWRVHHSNDAWYAMLAAAARPQIGTVALAATVASVALSEDGKTLATVSGNGTVQLWNAAKQQQIGHTITIPDGSPVASVALSGDGKTLATGSDDGTVQLWNAATQQQIGHTITTPIGSPVASVALSGDGKTLATVSSIGNSTAGTVRLWNVDTQQEIDSTITNSGRPDVLVALSRDGKTLATAVDGTVQIWDLATQQQIGNTITIPGGSQLFYFVALSRDGKTLATVSDDGTVRLWNAATQQQIDRTITATIRGGSHVYLVALSQDGKTLATVSGNGYSTGTVRLWNAATSKQIDRTITIRSGSRVASVAFGQDGKSLATGSADGTVRLWNAATQQQIGHTITIPDGSLVNSVALSQDGKTLATGSHDGTMQLWDVATQQQISTVAIPGGSPVTSVPFGQDGTTLATGSTDGTVRLWDVSYLADPVSDLCASAGQPLTRAEWKQYAPGLAYQSVCPAKTESAAS